MVVHCLPVIYDVCNHSVEIRSLLTLFDKAFGHWDWLHLMALAIGSLHIPYGDIRSVCCLLWSCCVRICRIIPIWRRYLAGPLDYGIRFLYLRTL